MSHSSRLSVALLAACLVLQVSCLPTVIPVPAGHSGLLHEETIRGPAHCGWLRVFFSELTLPAGVHVVITSLHDGAQQHLDHLVAQQWQLSTAFFNGDSVLLQVFAQDHPLLVASPSVYQAAFGKTEKSTEAREVRLMIDWIQHGPVVEGKEKSPENLEKSICFSPDTRVFSNDTRQGRCMCSLFCKRF